jgi:hypothetical protein
MVGAGANHQASRPGVAPGLVPPPARDAGSHVHSANPSRERSLCPPVALAVEDCAAELGDCSHSINASAATPTSIIVSTETRG